MGGVIVSDQAEAMLEGARARAIALGLSNVEFQVLNAEWIDLPVASVDAVLCRWGYMLMADPAAALAETRRVLRPGGRVALAVWDTLESNPWALLPARELIARGLAPRPDPDAAAAAGAVCAGSARAHAGAARAGRLRRGADRGARARRAATRASRSCGRRRSTSRARFHDAVLSRPASEIAEIEASLAERFAPYTAADGTLEIPGRTLVASASA